MAVKRYSLDWEERQFYENCYTVHCMAPNQNGSFVKYEDYEKLLQKAEQLKRVHEAAMEAWAKQTKDLHFFLEQSVIIEHKQDHVKMRKLRKEYGYDF